MHITALYAALVTLLFVLLSARVIARRTAARVSLGDGGDAELQRRIRAHANCAEYAPIALILIGLAEDLATPAWWLHVLGVALLAGRLFHAAAISLRGAPDVLRIAGMSLTFATLILGALTDLKSALSAY